MIAIGSDHAGYPLKEEIKKHLESKGLVYKDFGTSSTESCNYAEMAVAPCKAVRSGKCLLAILICGTGIGISIAANKHNGIRAAACSDYFSAKFTRLHNNANALCLGARVVGAGLAIEMVDIFLATEFECGRHTQRVQYFTEIEKGENHGA